MQYRIQDGFYKKTFNITINGIRILQGWGDQKTGLWRLPLHTKIPIKQNLNLEPMIQANNVGQISNIQGLIKYIHAAAFGPLTYTQIVATKKGYLQS